jgi:hypothetical protein
MRLQVHLDREAVVLVSMRPGGNEKHRVIWA